MPKMNIEIILLMGILINPTAYAAVHWAYIPDPPVLHPTVWSGPQIQVFSNNSKLLGLPLAMEQQSAIGLPICFLFNSTSQPGCLNLTGPWFDEYGLQVLQEINMALGRSKRAVAVVVAGILAVVALVVTATTAAISLSNSVQTATFVNDLTKNVSLAMGSQESIDEKIEQKLDALYETVNFLGEVQALKPSSRLRCHVQYRCICVTPKRYNRASHPWDKIKNHLQGIWHSANMSLDFVQLHRDTLALKEAPELQINTDQTVQEFIKGLKGLVPTWGPFTHLLGFVIVLACFMLVILCLLPYLLKCVIQAVRDVGSKIHAIKLRNKNAPI
ncbi:carbohydrate sulfotransferase 6 isoform X2 [Pteropus alecto]|uniref:carbohydrate sulfotransferase 6 isoform X2 n=1 Tax=Pteropus alecto TaxID=9402 RepID=UPI000D534582|nr:carbohydrate sulfotransferase 6 isoform X2 [Pteropus alecto]